MSKIICGKCRKPKSSLRHNLFCPFILNYLCKTYGKTELQIIDYIIENNQKSFVDELLKIPNFETEE